MPFSKRHISREEGPGAIPVPFIGTVGFPNATTIRKKRSSYLLTPTAKGFSATLFAVAVFVVLPVAILLVSEKQRHALLVKLAGIPHSALLAGTVGIGIMVLLLGYSLCEQLQCATVEIDEGRGEVRFYKGWSNRHLLTLPADQIIAINVAWERLQITRISARYNAVLLLQTRDGLWYAVCTTTRVSVMKRLVEILQRMSGCSLRQGALEVANPQAIAD